MLDPLNPAVLELIAAGQKHGVISFDQLNALLPDNYVDPDKLDELLVLFERLEITLVDPKHIPAAAMPKNRTAAATAIGETPEPPKTKAALEAEEAKAAAAEEEAKAAAAAPEADEEEDQRDEGDDEDAVHTGSCLTSGALQQIGGAANSE